MLLCDAIIRLGAERRPGIFREAANVELVKYFSNKIDCGDLDCLLLANLNSDDSMENIISDVLVACDLLKIWLRKLPEPLIPFSCYSNCVSAGLRTDVSLAKVIN